MRRVMVLAALTALVVPGVALANPAGRTFENTFPYAARLCARADAGKLGKKLASQSAQVKADCADLKSAFGSAKSDAVSSLSQIQQTRQSDRATMQQQCAQAKKNHDPAACKQARQTFRGQQKDLNAQQRQTLKRFHQALESARKTFWSKIHALRGGKGLKQDGSANEN